MWERHEPFGRPVTRRRFLLAALGGAGVFAGGSYALARALSSEGGTTAAPLEPPDRLAEFAANIQSGGPPKDGIPPIDEPHFVSAREAGFLSDEDVVFGLARDGEARAYPQLVLVWHEIVNDELAGEPVSVTYCPLTGSTVAFRGTAPNGEPYTFGTSGKLVNSNLLMYDRQTDSRWPQILGQAILGPSRGRSLEEIPLDWTTWGRWRRAHPDSLVLSTKTGHLRAYGTDPYGTYTPIGGYYAEGSGRFFPVMHEDDRFDDKEVFVGVKVGGGRLAVHKDLLRRRGLATAKVAGTPLAVVYDAGPDEGRAFLARAGSRELELEADEAGSFVDKGSGTTWDATGRARDGLHAGTRLEQLVSYDVMWFAWVSFFPKTEVVA